MTAVVKGLPSLKSKLVSSGYVACAGCLEGVKRCVITVIMEAES